MDDMDKIARRDQNSGLSHREAHRINQKKRGSTSSRNKNADPSRHLTTASSWNRTTVHTETPEGFNNALDHLDQNIPARATSIEGSHLSGSTQGPVPVVSDVILPTNDDHSRIHSLESFKMDSLSTDEHLITIPSSKLWLWEESWHWDERTWVAYETEIPVPSHLQSRLAEIRDETLINLKEVQTEMMKKQAKETSYHKQRPSRRNLHVEIRMSGHQKRLRKTVVISPCIWILCGSKEFRDMVRKALKGGLAGSIARNLSSSRVEIHAKAPEFNATEALVPLPQLRRDIEKDNRLIGQIISRVGGLLVNGFELFDNIDVPIAMTTSHGLFDYIRQNDGAASALMDITISSFKPNLPGNEYDPITISDSEPDSDSSSDVSGPGSDSGDAQSTQLAWREEQSLGRRDPATVYKWMAIEEVIGLKFAKHQFPRGVLDSSKPSDYALLTSADLAGFRNATSWRNLAPELPSDEITSSLKNDELTEGSLLMVFARDEVKEVTLLPGISTMPSAQGDPLEVRRIQLSAPLARGTSGTWLVKGSAFAGMVVAFYPNQPMAMFITAQDLLQSIAESFPDLLLPSKDRPQDPLAQSQAHRQSRADAFGHSAENQGTMQNTVFGVTTENVLGNDPEYTPSATNEK
ncbi:hypothetical protein CABS01_06088 [Colletotrichum abscissum]|uniref:Uncharacterized protein n=1 Tax=Colletotrichum abscissum TaxID=1671311 RepID=A0A9P9XBR7_9PEZI|nr:uncharacterized protein CABS01_06088 [Colletotrichum abscissum]KAI3546706.1 hypothetical protein CABS02_08899 [Colletotrichum abscissum]KAK1518554.1 hypothetical protein CABS01_06088 [Colletotrichum abscissum]